MKLIKLLLSAVLMLSPSLGVAQTSFFTDRAVGVSQFNGFTGLVPISYGQVRVCNLPLTVASPCQPVATIQNISGQSMTINGGNFGQITTDVVGRFNFKAAVGDYWIQVAASSSNTPQLSYPISVGNTSNSFRNFEGIRYADQFSSIQAAIDDCPVGGCTVKIPVTGSPYNITTALHPKAGVLLECDSAGVVNTGTVITTTGAIWAYENSSPTTQSIVQPGIINCTFNLSGNPLALGGVNLRSISWGQFYNVNVVLPTAGAMDGFRFDAQDVAYGGFWNECFHCVVYDAGNGNTNTHNGFHWVNGANNNNLFGGEVTGTNTCFKLESGDHNTILAPGCENSMKGLDLAGTGNSVNNNLLFPSRLESLLAGAQGVLISAGSIDNQISTNPVGYANALLELNDSSAGKNIVNVESANQHTHIAGDSTSTGKFGFNMTGTQIGIEVNGLLGSTRATGNAADFKSSSGAQSFFAGAFDSYGAARLGTTSNDPVAFFTNNSEVARFSAAGALSVTNTLSATKFLSATNCASTGGTCGSASAGSVSIAAAATTVTVSTTAVTANSQILVFEDASLGTRLSVTCNTTTGRTYTVTSRTAATSFVITASAAPAANPACLSYIVVN